MRSPEACRMDSNEDMIIRAELTCSISSRSCIASGTSGTFGVVLSVRRHF